VLTADCSSAAVLWRITHGDPCHQHQCTMQKKILVAYVFQGKDSMLFDGLISSLAAARTWLHIALEKKLEAQALSGLDRRGSRAQAEPTFVARSNNETSRAGPTLRPCDGGDKRGPKTNRGPIFSIYLYHYIIHQFKFCKLIQPNNPHTHNLHYIHQINCTHT
jgi:hypothetical protein